MCVKLRFVVKTFCLLDSNGRFPKTRGDKSLGFSFEDALKFAARSPHEAIATFEERNLQTLLQSLIESFLGIELPEYPAARRLAYRFFRFRVSPNKKQPRA